MSSRNSDLNFIIGSEKAADNNKTLEALMTVKNENLFSMMKDSVERDQEEQNQNSQLNLSKIMGNLQTFKDK